MKINLYTFSVLLGLVLGSFTLQAQSQSALDQALRFVEENQEKWNFTSADIKDISVSDIYPSKNGTYHVILQQNYRGIGVSNASINVTITPKGKTYTVGTPRFHQNLKSKVNANNHALSAEDAIRFAIGHLQNTDLRVPPMDTKLNDQSYIFAGGDVSRYEIPVFLQYRANEAGEVVLCWELTIKEMTNSDWWQMHIDANSGELVSKYNYTVSCQFHDHAFHRHTDACEEAPARPAPLAKEVLRQESQAMVPNSYHVFPLPGESPLHIAREIVVDPADLVASPYGWHDTNGIPGADETITLGNNVHAFQDQDGNDVSSGDEPDGGADLEFDFPYDVNSGSINDYTDAATVNLFYSVNKIHDFTYHYGFDEPSGNFQFRNYTNTGQGSDQVIAQSQDGFLTGSVNNANFGTPPDGNSGSMQMFVWDRNVGGGVRYLQIDAPASVVGGYAATSAGLTNNGFGPPPPTTPIVGEIVEVKDAKYDPFITDGCEDLINPDEIAGKIALVDRGGCSFESKAIRAEAAGAIAVIICNFEEEPVGMLGTADPDPSIPTIMIGTLDCQQIRVHAGSGLMASIGVPSDPGPEFLDGDFDNGIIAHEFGHGISNRLTNGPSNTGCLGNGEQMGEGWSDFFSLVTTVRTGDVGGLKRGIGNFVDRQPINGNGIRTYPYSTDMSINPHTYSDISNESVPHGVGSVWCAMLWDLYWRLVDEYGFDEDIITGTGGNNTAVALVMEGMKQQPCGPGFIDGRDAIIAADIAMNNGVNECLIWEVFANRGLGFYASQGDPNLNTDPEENFDPMPFCTEALQIRKEVTDKLNAGEAIDVKVIVTNYKPGPVTGVVISDELLSGLTYIAGSGNVTGDVQGDMVFFEVGDLISGQSFELTYQLATDPTKGSISQLYFDCENQNGWLIDAPADNPINWENNGQDPYAGNRSWRVDALPQETRQAIFMQNSINIGGAKPVVRFFHSHITQTGIDGGIVQVSTDDNAEIWFDQEVNFLREQYTGGLDYSTFVIPNQSGFSGNSNGFKESYIDLSQYAGNDLRLRFDFATDEDSGPNGGFWSVDDIEFMDMINYDGTATATTQEGDNVSTNAGNLGTVVLQGSTSTEDLEAANLQFQLFPNPANDMVNIIISSEESRAVNLSILTIDGRELMNKQARVDAASQTIPMDVSRLAPGFYFVRATTGNTSMVEKIVIE